MLPQRTALIGRDDHLDQLGDALEAVARRIPRRALVSGDSGLGRTRLLDAVAEEARLRRWTVLRSTGDPVDAVQPLAALRRAIGDVGGRGDDDTIRSVIGGNVAERRLRDEAEIVTHLCARTADAPVLLAVDDVDLVDDSTRRLLGRLITLMPNEPLLVVTTQTRSVDPPHDDRQLSIELAPWTDAEVGTFVANVLGPRRDDLAPAVRRALDGAAGVPLVVAAVLAELLDGIEPVTGRGGRFDARASIRSRLDRLPDATLDVVRTIAVVGRSIELEELLALREEGDPLVTSRAIDTAVDAHLVDVDGDRVTIRNALVVDELRARIPAAVQRSVHGLVAAMLTERRAAPARIAHHALRASGTTPSRAVELLLVAARDVGSRAPTVAVELLDRALEIVDPDDPHRVDVLAEMVTALGWTGAFDRCEVTAAAVLAEPVDEPRRATTRRSLALCAFMQNRAADAAEQCERSAAEANDPRTRARALGEAALAHIAAADQWSADVCASEAIDLGSRTGEPISGSLGWSVRSRLRAFDLALDESLAASERAMEIAAQDETGEAALYHPGFFRLLTLLDLDRLDDARVILDRERAVGGRAGLAWTQPLHDGLGAVIDLFTGRLREAAVAAADGLGAVESTGSGLAAAWLHGVAALTALHRGDVRDARRHVDAGNVVAGAQVVLLGIDLLALAEARVAEAEGDRARALDVADGSLRVFAELGMPLCARVLGGDVVRLAALTGRTAVLEAAAGVLAQVADRTDLPIDVAQARLAAATERDDAELALEAVAAVDGTERTLDRAVMREGAARVLWAAGRREAAAELLEEARAGYEALGAPAEAGRVVQTFADLGLRRPRRRPRARPDELTLREATIAELVSNGRTNAEVAQHLGLSPRTVETHLTRIYAKLGLRSRTELAAARRPS